MQEKVSIIMPAYNVEKYIRYTLESVQLQTYQNWECIIVDDCSNDNTLQIINEYCAKDKRFVCIRLKENSGAAIARNTAIEYATGKYLAFLDSDDIWKKEKLEKQIEFMENNNYSFTCTHYGKIDENGNILHQVIKAKNEYDYYDILKGCPGNSTVIYNCKKMGKIYISNVKKRNDFVMWIKAIKIEKNAYGLTKILTYHRIRKNSISYRKCNLLKYQWHIYRKMEKLSIAKCLYFMTYKIGNAILRKIY